MGIFDGLDMLGFTEIPEIDLFKKPTKAKDKNVEKEITVRPEDFLFEKAHSCPVCDKEFKNTAVRKGKLRYLHSDSDLRPTYEPIDPLYYDVVMCQYCGYAALSSLFTKITDRAAETVYNKIAPLFKSRHYPLLLTAEMAVERYKLALYITVIKGGKNGEKAYICLKLAWLYRHLRDIENEKLFITQAYQGLKDAYSQEAFPICGLDEPTTAYLVAELARRVGEHSEALRWIGNLLVRRNINVRLRERAEIVKDTIRSELQAKK